MLLKNLYGHFMTITKHRHLVMEHCFRVGLYKQGLLHDLSKYSPKEFISGVKYYQGYRSPNSAEREKIGYSAAWLHHKGRNKHHMEYWIDYPLDGSDGMVGMKMPVKYVVEMFCDRVAASKIYNKEKYTDKDALTYYLNHRNHYIIHPQSEKLLRYLLVMLAKRGEDETFEYINTCVLKGRR
ncbi:MAG: DUF5662 family protein [bacterium]|nr:DUF5662 family protein [bacterium]